MRTSSHHQNSEVQIDSKTNELELPVVHTAYHEMADQPVVEKDAAALLSENIAVLEDLQGRLSFVMREVRYLMKV